MSDYTPSELMAAVMARDFVDGEVVVMGAVPGLPMSACRLAKATHAPHLSYIVGGSGAVNPTPHPPPASSCDGSLSEAETVLPLSEVVLLEGRGDALDVFCSGGLQIDVYGNCNLICVGDWASPALRGPGTVGLPFLPAVRRSVIYTAAHTPRTLMERVDFVSGPGHPRRGGGPGRYGGLGPTLVVTPLSTFDFDPETHRMRLASVHPGVETDEVLAKTGFEPAPGPEPAVTEPPTETELAILRSFDEG